MAKTAEFRAGDGEIDPFSIPVHFPSGGQLIVTNNDSNLHSVVWDDPGSPAGLLSSPANGQDLNQGDSATFNLAGLPQGTFTFRDGHAGTEPGHSCQLVVGTG